jgi:hypothetical protein
LADSEGAVAGLIGDWPEEAGGLARSDRDDDSV